MIIFRQGYNIIGRYTTICYYFLQHFDIMNIEHDQIIFREILRYNSRQSFFQWASNINIVASRPFETRTLDAHQMTAKGRPGYCNGHAVDHGKFFSTLVRSGFKTGTSRTYYTHRNNIQTNTYTK